jgi:hypothetical protein
MRLTHAIAIFVFVVVLSACQSDAVEKVQPVSEIPGSSVARAVTVTVFGSLQYGSYPLGLNAEWLAFQDGSGVWKTVQGIEGRYSFDVTNASGKYGIVLTCPQSPPSSSFGLRTYPETLQFGFLTIADTNAPEFSCNVLYDPDLIAKSDRSLTKLSNSIRGVAANERVFGKVVDVDSNEDYSRQIAAGYAMDLHPGNYSILLAKFVPPENAGAFSSIFSNQAIADRNLSVRADLNLEYDFSTQAFDLLKKSISIQGVQGNENLILTGGTIINRSRVDLSIDQSKSGQPAQVYQFSSIPDEKLRPNELHFLHAVTQEIEKNDSKYRLIDIGASSMPNSIQLPNTLRVESKLAEQMPHVRPELTWDRKMPENGKLFMSFSENIPAIGNIPYGLRSWSINFSSAWLGTKNTFTLPDLSSLPGWRSRWGFTDLAQMTWSVHLIEATQKWDYQVPYSQKKSSTVKPNLIRTAGFIHQPLDAAPPIISSTSPSIDSENSSVTIVNSTSPEIVVNFSQVMDTSSVELAYQSENLPASNINLTWLGYQPGFAYLLKITPKLPLAAATTYSFTIGASARNLSGVAMVKPRTFVFRTP